MFICVCKAVTEKELREQLESGVRNPRELCERTGAGTECGSCLRRLEQMAQGESEEGTQSLNIDLKK